MIKPKKLVHELHLMIAELFNDGSFPEKERIFAYPELKVPEWPGPMDPVSGPGAVIKPMLPENVRMFHVVPQPYSTFKDAHDLNVEQWISKFNFRSVAKEFFRHFRGLNSTIVSLPLQIPPVEFVAQELMNNFWLRIIKTYVVDIDALVTRIDVKYRILCRP